MIWENISPQNQENIRKSLRKFERKSSRKKKILKVFNGK